MILHVVMTSRLVAEHRHEALKVRELSIEEIAKLNKALSLVGAFNRNYSLYEICIANYEEIEKFYNSIKSSTGIDLDFAHNTATEMNRLLLNYLSSFRTFADHQETELSHISTHNIKWLEHFKEQTASYYDNHFAYRFLWNLRNYVQHCGLPLGGFSVTGRVNESGEEEPFFSIYFNRDSLLNNYKKWKKVVRDDLSNQAEEIDVMEQVRVLRDCIEDLATTVSEIHIHRLSEYWDFLVDIVNAVLSQYPEGSPCIGRWRVDEGKDTLLGLTPLPIHTILKIQDIWNEFEKDYNVEEDEARDTSIANEQGITANQLDRSASSIQQQ